MKFKAVPEDVTLSTVTGTKGKQAGIGVPPKGMRIPQEGTIVTPDTKNQRRWN